MRPAARSWSSTTSRRSARSCAATCSGRATRRTWRSTVSRRWRWRPRAGPTSWCSTSCCRASTAWRRCAASARWEAGARRSSCSPRAVRSPTASSACGSAPTTTSSSRSRRPSWWRVSMRSCGASTPSPSSRRRCASTGSSWIRAGGACSSTARRWSLTQREFELLLFLARHPGQAFTRNQLMDHVWDYSFYTDTSTVTVHIRRLRAKLEDDAGAPALDRDGVGRRLPLRGMRRLAGSLGFAVAHGRPGGGGGAHRLRTRGGARDAEDPGAAGVRHGSRRPRAGARARAGRKPAPPIRGRRRSGDGCSSRPRSCSSSTRCSSPRTTRSSPSSPLPTPRH